MAKYRELIFNKPVPQFTEATMVLSGKHDDYYVLAIGRLRVFLTPSEKEAIIDTWNKIDNGELKRGEES